MYILLVPGWNRTPFPSSVVIIMPWKNEFQPGWIHKIPQSLRRRDWWYFGERAEVYSPRLSHWWSKHGPPQCAWDPDAAEQWAHVEPEGAAKIRTLSRKTYIPMQHFFFSSNQPYYYKDLLRELISPDKYHELMRGLNTKQRQAMNFHRRWCKDGVLAMKKGEPIKP